MAINKFGVTAVRNAWYDSKQVTDHVVQGYTKVMSLLPCCLMFEMLICICLQKSTASKSQGMGQSSCGIHGGYING